MAAKAPFSPIAADDCRAVVTAAGLLDVKEFEFFRLAYRRWFGEQPLPEVLERTFARYMLSQVVPPWVRKLSRDVMTAGAKGSVDRRAFGAERYRDFPVAHPRGRLFVAGFMAIWAILFVMLLQTAPAPQAAETTAGCWQQTGAPAIEAWVNLLAGKRQGCAPPAGDIRR